MGWPWKDVSDSVRSVLLRLGVFIAFSAPAAKNVSDIVGSVLLRPIFVRERTLRTVSETSFHGRAKFTPFCIGVVRPQKEASDSV